MRHLELLVRGEKRPGESRRGEKKLYVECGARMRRARPAECAAAVGGEG